MADVDSSNGSSDTRVSSGTKYLQDVLGDVLAKALSAVARERPEDPVQYVADFLNDYDNRKKKEALTKDDDHDSGHYDADSSARSNESTATLSTVDIKDQNGSASNGGGTLEPTLEAVEDGTASGNGEGLPNAAAYTTRKEEEAAAASPERKPRGELERAENFEFSLYCEHVHL